MPRAQKILEKVPRADREQFAVAVALSSLSDVRKFVSGVCTYHGHPYRRDCSSADVIWSDGSARLLAYGTHGRPVLLVPSLINRYYILDLLPESSFCKWLMAHGFRPLVLDWGEPGPAELRFGVDDYVMQFLVPALDHALQHAQRPLAMMGYCMGGLLALAAAILRPSHIRSLVLLATPWDFHAASDEWKFVRSMADSLDGMRNGPPMPVDMIQIMFSSVQPGRIHTKFQRFAECDPESEQARIFVALEDWLNDGVELAAPTTHDCLIKWYRDNLPGNGRWLCCNKLVEPSALDLPVLVAVPTRDRIVPPESARALVSKLSKPSVLEPRAGHVGMMVGQKAEQSLWQPIREWVDAH